MPEAAESQSGASRKTVLIVDDDENLLKLLRYGLTRAGYETTSARNGKEAMDALQEGAADLILVDMMMPEMDGLRFLRWLRETGSTRPALVFTSVGSPRVAEEAREAGAADVIVKPVQLPQLVAKVAELLG